MSAGITMRALDAWNGSARRSVATLCATPRCDAAWLSVSGSYGSTDGLCACGSESEDGYADAALSRAFSRSTASRR
jgi:hypothetical protein